jgi:cytochrome c oxidase subunit II
MRWRSSVLLALIAALSAVSCSTYGAPEGATTEGRDISDLYSVFFVVAAGVAAIVYGLIVWCVVRYRRRPGDDALPAQFRAHVPLEIVYTAIPVLIVIVLFVLTYRTEQRVQSLAAAPAATIRVTGFAWQWRFDYAGTDVSVLGTPAEQPEMVVPVDVPVRIELRSVDVIHAFWVPDFLFKRDAIPGRITRFQFTVEEPGVYAGHCAEFCGLGHARMDYTVRAVPAAEFDSWLATMQQEPAA